MIRADEFKRWMSTRTAGVCVTYLNLLLLSSTLSTFSFIYLFYIFRQHFPSSHPKKTQAAALRWNT